MTIVQGDQKYIYFYLRENDGTTPVDISNADTITFRMKRYGETTVCFEATCSVVTGTLGYCRVFLTTVATSRAGEPDYRSEVEVVEGNAIVTWLGPTIKIEEELG